MLVLPRYGEDPASAELLCKSDTISACTVRHVFEAFKEATLGILGKDKRTINDVQILSFRPNTGGVGFGRPMASESYMAMLVFGNEPPNGCCVTAHVDQSHRVSVRSYLHTPPHQSVVAQTTPMADASTHSQMLSLSVSGLARAAGWGCDSDNDNEAELTKARVWPAMAMFLPSLLADGSFRRKRWRVGSTAPPWHPLANRAIHLRAAPRSDLTRRARRARRAARQVAAWTAGAPAAQPCDAERRRRGGAVAAGADAAYAILVCGVVVASPVNGGKRHKHSPTPKEGHVWGSAEKSYELCVGVANHITTIAMLYSETYTLKHYAVFLCYCIFTASIMHVTSLFAYPTDPHGAYKMHGRAQGDGDCLAQRRARARSPVRHPNHLLRDRVGRQQPRQQQQQHYRAVGAPLSIDAPCLRTRSSASLFVYIPSKFTSLYGCPILLPSPLRSRFRRALLNQDPTAMLHPYPRPLVSPSPSSSFYAPFLPLPSRSVLAFPVAYPPARCRHLIHILSRAAHRAACHATAFVQVHKSRSKAALQRRDATRTTLWRASCNVLQCTYMVRRHHVPSAQTRRDAGCRPRATPKVLLAEVWRAEFVQARTRSCAARYLCIRTVYLRTFGCGYRARTVCAEFPRCRIRSAARVAWARERQRADSFLRMVLPVSRGLGSVSPRAFGPALPSPHPYAYTLPCFEIIRLEQSCSHSGSLQFLTLKSWLSDWIDCDCLDHQPSQFGANSHRFGLTSTKALTPFPSLGPPLHDLKYSFLPTDELAYHRRRRPSFTASTFQDHLTDITLTQTMVKLLTDSSLLIFVWYFKLPQLQLPALIPANRNRLTASHRRCAGAIFKSDLLGIIVGILMSFASSSSASTHFNASSALTKFLSKPSLAPTRQMIVEIDLKFCFKPSSASLSGEIDLASQFFDSRFSLGPLPYFNGLGLQGLLPQISITSNYNVSTPNSYRLDVYIRKLEDLLPSKLPQYEFSWLFKSAATYTTEFQLVQTNVSLIPNVATLKDYRQFASPRNFFSFKILPSSSVRHPNLVSSSIFGFNSDDEFSPGPGRGIYILIPFSFETFNPSTPTDLTDIPPKFWLDWTAEIIGNLGGRLTVSFYFKCIVAKSHFNRTTSSTSYRLAHINVIQPSVSSPRSYFAILFEFNAQCAFPGLKPTCQGLMERLGDERMRDIPPMAFCSIDLSTCIPSLINLFSTALDYCCIWQEMYTGTTAQFKKVKVSVSLSVVILIQCSKIAWGIKDTSSMERGA
ncbi:hypothetical protein C8F04DRAFT_1198807 [Mycena alexandri]|uniref:Uncharacterized protein n=1 Tax=Mycena alexandri TaxID=1745969 RepID=A0AAD6WP64_9AGAR|nr:hypothetical protein C8F04DRAFT_1198807 [Mycena alexandri]